MSLLSDILTIAAIVTGNGWIALASGVSRSNDARSATARAQRQARDAYNASLKDRLEMVDILPDAPRTLVLGRVRAVEGVRRRWVSGANGEKLTMVISFAGHQIDGFEKWYFNDEEVELDAAGWVITAPYNKGKIDSHSQVVAWPGGAHTVELGHVPIAGSVVAAWHPANVDDQGGPVLPVSVVGTTATFDSGPSSGTYVTVAYQAAATISTARIRAYTGAPGQNIGAALASEYPDKITATDRFEGMALAVVDILYDPDVYPQGRPNITALMRGARLYDPRLDSDFPGGTGPQRVGSPATWVWSENSALCAHHYARWAHGFALPASEIRTADVFVAAAAADVSTAFTLRKVDASTTVVTLPRYRCGIVISSAADPRASMGEILETMAGRSGWAGGTWRLRAGVMASPSFTLDAGWLAQPLGADGQPERSAVLRVTTGVQRDQKINRVSGKCIDPDQRWQVLPFPAVEDATLIAAEGEYATEVEYQGINHIAHAQHLASVAIRENRAGLRLDAACNLHAYRCELFDVATLLLPRYGMTAGLGKTAEVTGWRWSPTEGVRLQLAEIAPAMFTPLAELTGRDPAPNSALPAITDVEVITITAVTSGTVALTDGSVLTRTRVQWSPAVSQAIRSGGQIEVQYAELGGPLPSGDWPSWVEPGAATEAVIPGLRTGAWHIFKLRAVKTIHGVRGMWGAHEVHRVAAAPAVQWSAITGAGKPASYATVGKSLGLPFESWALNGQALVALSDGKVGTSALRLSGAGGGYPNQGNYIPIDRSKKYRTRFWARPMATTGGLLYFSLQQFIGAGGVTGPVNGGRSPYKPSGQSRAGHNAQFGGTDQWGEYSNIWDAADWQAGVQFVRPDFLDNYSGGAGHWDVQDFSFEEVTEVIAARTAADAAAAAAETAQDAAETANAALEAIASDSVLTRGEKPPVILNWQAIGNEYAGIDAQAGAYGIVTQRANYGNAISALASYLASLSPAWNDTATDTAINGGDFRANFAAVYYHRQLLLDQIAAAARGLANAAQETADSAAAAASAAQDAADTAQSAANTANTTLADIASDAVLTRGEKPAVMISWQAISDEYTGIWAQASAYGIVAERLAYDTAWSALSSYLGGLTPAYNDASADTPIVGATFRAKFADLYAARQVLLNKTAAIAGTLATWASVSGTGKPADNATVGAQFGVNISGQAASTDIQDNAITYTAVYSDATGVSICPAC